MNANIVHIYGVSSDDIDGCYRFQLNNLIKKSLPRPRLYDEPATDVFSALYNGDFELPADIGEGIDVEASDSNAFYLGFPIQLPWSSPVKDKRDADARLQKVFEYLFKDVPEDFTEITAREWRFGYIDDF